jgi:hypothetical protein
VPVTVAVVGVAGATGSIVVLLLLHTPPPIILVSVAVCVRQTSFGPPIGYGATIRYTPFDTLQPVGSVYVIVVAKVSTPVARPVTGSIVSIDGLALVQVPPAGLLVYRLCVRLQKALLPAIGVGRPFTVNTTVLAQPVDVNA